MMSLETEINVHVIGCTEHIEIFRIKRLVSLITFLLEIFQVTFAFFAAFFNVTFAFLPTLTVILVLLNLTFFCRI